MKHLIAAAFIVATFGLSAPTTHACFCLKPGVPGAFDKAKAVFVGEVAEIIEPRTSDEKAPLPGRFFTIKFKIEKSWKGVALAAREISVLSAQGHYGCFAFPPVNKGERYLVYADPAHSNGAEDKGWSIITDCNRTSLINSNHDSKNEIDPYFDMRELDAIKASPFNFDFKQPPRARRRSKAGE